METGMKAIMLAFITVIVGTVLLTSTANTQVDVTEVKSVVNESVSLVNQSTSSLANNQLVAVSRVGNATVTLFTTDYDVNLDQGTITLDTLNGTIQNRAYDVSYTYHKVGNSTARTLVTLIPLFFALAVFFAILAALNPQFREMMGGLGK